VVSPADKRAIRGLGRLLGQLDPDRVLLALPATLGRAAAAQLLGALGPLKADALVVTHADETDQIGVAIEAACRFGLAPEYMLSHARSGGWQLRRLDPAVLAAMVLP
jgi:flagellar biosynthesis GTPase FlhF